MKPELLVLAAWKQKDVISIKGPKRGVIKGVIFEKLVLMQLSKKRRSVVQEVAEESCCCQKHRGLNDGGLLPSGQLEAENNSCSIKTSQLTFLFLPYVFFFLLVLALYHFPSPISGTQIRHI